MKKIPIFYYIIILVGLLVYSLYIYDHSGITGFFSGDFKVNIGNPNNFFNENKLITNGTFIDTALNTSLLFKTNGSMYGLINVTSKNNNPMINHPMRNAFTERISFNKFLIINSNLTFQNVTITFKYKDSELGNIDESSLKVHKFNNATGNWDVLPGSVDTSLNEVFGITNSFSTFGVFGDYVEQPSTIDTGTDTNTRSSGKSVAEIKEDFTVAPQIITTTLLQEQGKSLNLQIKNTGDKKIDIKINMQNLNEFAIISENDFVLDIGETKVVRLDLFALSEQKPGISIREIVVNGISTEKIINLVIEVKEREPLFDIRIKVLPEYKNVVAGGRLVVLIQLENIGLRGKLVDVESFLSIMDFDKKILYELSKETLAIGTQFSTIREINIPSYMPVGKYLAMAEMKHNNITINSYDTFDVVEKKEVEIEKPVPSLSIISTNFLIIAILITIIIFAIAVYFLFYKKMKN